MHRCRAILLIACIFAALAACHGTKANAGPQPIACTLVLLKTAPVTVPMTKDESGKIFAGHFANMERLAKAGWLLVAGPFGARRTDPALRGLFVIDAEDRGRATELAESDPSVQAGVFSLEYHDLVTSSPLRVYLAAELAKREAAEREGKKPQPGEGGRGYVLLTATNGDAAERALAHQPMTLLFARLDGSQALVLLDARDEAVAKALLAPLAARLGPYKLDEWFSSGGLADLKLLRP